MPLFVMHQPPIGRDFLRGGATIIDAVCCHRSPVVDVTVVDIPHLTVDEQRLFGQSAILPVVIDDDSPGPFACDILIRPNLHEFSSSAFGKQVPECWQGKEYIILHPDFSEVRTPPRNEREVKQILVCFGGSDPGRLTIRVLPLLINLFQKVRIQVVVGPSLLDMDQVRELTASAPNVILTVNCPSMADAFSAADLALISGGTLLYEACAMAVPSLVICQNLAQNHEAAIFAERGGVKNLGIHDWMSDQDLILGLKELSADFHARKEMAEAEKRLVARDGTRRIVSQITNRVLHRKGEKIV